jgi:hypothetical protein
MFKKIFGFNFFLFNIFKMNFFSHAEVYGEHLRLKFCKQQIYFLKKH